MLYLGIDQHARQLTVSLRDQQGDVLLTRPAKVLGFFDQLTQRCTQAGERFIAVLEAPKQFPMVIVSCKRLTDTTLPFNSLLDRAGETCFCLGTSRRMWGNLPTRDR